MIRGKSSLLDFRLGRAGALAAAAIIAAGGSEFRKTLGLLVENLDVGDFEVAEVDGKGVFFHRKFLVWSSEGSVCEQSNLRSKRLTVEITYGRHDLQSEWPPRQCGWPSEETVRNKAE